MIKSEILRKTGQGFHQYNLEEETSLGNGRESRHYGQPKITP